MEYSETSLSRDEHNVARRALQIVVAYAGVHGKTAFLVVLLVSINTEYVVYNDIICCAASWEAGTRV